MSNEKHSTSYMKTFHHFYSCFSEKVDNIQVFNFFKTHSQISNKERIPNLLISNPQTQKSGRTFLEKCHVCICMVSSSAN